MDSNSSPRGRTPAGSKPSGVGLALVIVGIIVLCAVVVAAVSAYQRAQKRQRAQTSETISRLQDDFREITKAGEGPDGLPQKIDKQIDAPPTAKGELGQMDKFVRQLMAQMVAQRNEYFSGLDTIGWNQVLDGTRIKRDAGLQSRQILAQARSLVDKYEAKSKGVLEGIPAAIRALDISEASKRDMMQGFEGTAAASRAQLVELWSLERQALAEIEGMLQILDSSRAGWTMEGGNFVFAEQRTLDVFNQRMASVQAITQKQTELQKRNANSALAKMEKLKQR